MECRQLWFFEEGRDLFKVIRRYWLLNVKCFNKAQMPIKKIFLWSVGLSLAAFSSVWSAEEPSLWQIQQILAGKRYVDLTQSLHRESRTGRDFRMRHAKQFTGMRSVLTSWEQVSSPNCIRMSANGARMWIPLLIS